MGKMEQGKEEDPGLSPTVPLLPLKGTETPPDRIASQTVASLELLDSREHGKGFYVV